MSGPPTSRHHGLVCPPRFGISKGGLEISKGPVEFQRGPSKFQRVPLKLQRGLGTFEGGPQPISSNLYQTWTIFSQLWPVMAEFRPGVANVRTFVQLWPMLAEIRPSVADCFPSLADVGGIWPTFVQCRPNLVNIQPNLANFGGLLTFVGQSWTNARPMLANRGETSSNIYPIWLTFAQFCIGRTSSNSGQHWSNSRQHWPNVVEC